MNQPKQQSRTKSGMSAGIFGIVCNLLLAVMKFTIGLFTGSISIQADAVNNFSDCAASVTSLIGFKMASKEADREHPFGHGRIEYIAGLVVSFLVIAISFEFFKSSLARIFSPAPVEYRLSLLVVLLLSIAAKFCMGVHYLRISRKIGSVAVKAAAVDSFSDMAVTSVAVVAFALSTVTSLPIDGYAGLIVAVFIFIGGIRMVRDTLDPLLGHSPDQTLANEVIARLNGYEQILGVHDLIMHDYGPDRVMASVHAEIPMDLSFKDAHGLIDDAESDVLEALGISLVIHGDPVDTKDLELQRVRSLLRRVLRTIDPALAFHDLRFHRDAGHSQLLFDLVIPFGIEKTVDSVIGEVSTAFMKIEDDFELKITADRQ